MMRHMTTSSVRSAFTLTEMLIAVAILSVVILATSTIFGTAQRVASVSEANSDLVQQAAAIERRIRRDIQGISTDGFLAIQCVAVENGINLADNGQLLDPDQPEFFEGTSIPVRIRCDQMIFFTNVKEPSTRFLQSYRASGEEGDGLAPVEGAAAMVYLGHGVQMPVQPPRASVDGASLWDHDRQSEPIYPWTFDSEYPVLPTGDVPIITPPVSRWVLTRRPVLLADDDLLGVIDNTQLANNYPSVSSPWDCNGVDPSYANANCNLFRTNDVCEILTPLLFSEGVSNGRVDISSSEFDDIRRDACVSWRELGLETESPNLPSPLVRKDEIVDAMFFGYPRGEREVPSMLNMDQMLRNNVLAGNLSDFRIEWTWSDGVGRDLTVSDSDFPGGLPGVVVNGNQQPWFGLGNVAVGSDVIGEPVFSAVNDSNNNIEVFPGSVAGVLRYGAVFGYNRDRAFLRGGDDRPIALPGDNGSDSLVFADTMGSSGEDAGDQQFVNTYTPWPSAVRITMRLHDPGNVIAGGRVFQFIVPLPKQD